MRFSLIPREMRFFDMFDDVTAHLTQGGVKFFEMVEKFDRLAERGKELKQEEETCDEIVGKIIRALDRTFITPFDREDIHTLATLLDDVLDNMEETAHRFEVFRIDRPTPDAVELARAIKDSCGHLEQAVRLLRDLRQSGEIQKHLKEISRLENVADDLYRKADAELFATANGSDDILRLIKWRELYAWMEETVDAAKEAAHIVSEIVIKGT